LSIEQMVREILEAAMQDRALRESLCRGVDPQTMTAGDLVSPANRLNEILGNRDKEGGASSKPC
jgi:hypothetical protein